MRIRAFLLTGLLAGIAAVPVAALASQGCAVTGLNGDTASVQSGGDWTALEPGALPDATEAVMTGAGTRLEITCDDGTVLTVGPDSEFAMADLMEQPETSIVMSLLGGIVGLVVAPREGRAVTVQTPVAIASVRSTEWLVEHGTDGLTAVFVREGRVAVVNDVADVVLESGQGVTVARDAVVKPVGAWGEARLAQVNAALGFGWE